MTLIALALCLTVAQVQDDLPPLGTNLAPFVEGSTQWALVDAMKMSQPWAAQDGTPLDIDANGNVKSLKPGQVAKTVVYSDAHHPLGKYTLIWKGTGDFEAGTGSTLTVETPGKGILEVSADNGIHLSLKKVDANDPPRDIKLIMPGYEETYSEQPFHPIFLQRMSLYRSLRFADWGMVATSPQAKWADRATTDLASYCDPKGVPYEVMIDLANEKVSIPWFCVPFAADDDYVRSFAKLVKERLRPDVRVVVEYAAAPWGKESPQAAWCLEHGRDTSEDPEESRLRYYSQRSTQVFAIFEEVFGGRDRLVRVLSSPADAKSAATILGWKDAARKADALAIAPYFGKSPGSPVTLEQLFDTLTAEVQGPLRDRLFELGTLAEKHRLKLLAYEGGQHLPVGVDPAADKLFDEACRDPRMAEVYLGLFKAWRPAGGLMFMHFNDCSAWTAKGRWGTIERQDQDPQTSYKNRALIQYALFPDR